MATSVAVTGRHFPARMTIGTSAQRQESAVSRIAAKVSTVDFGSTPSTSRYPSYCPRTMWSGVRGRSEATVTALESRQALRPCPEGGSARTVARTCSMWFWITSRIVPVRS